MSTVNLENAQVNVLVEVNGDICYDYDELVYRRSQYTDKNKWHVEERGYVPCSVTKMAL